MARLRPAGDKTLYVTSDKTFYVTRQGAIVADKAGKAITAYTSSDFDTVMKDVAKQLFGK